MASASSGSRDLSKLLQKVKRQGTKLGIDHTKGEGLLWSWPTALESIETLFQSELSKLSRDVAACRYEVAALCRCLERSGELSAQAWLAHVHRLSFDAYGFRSYKDVLSIFKAPLVPRKGAPSGRKERHAMDRHVMSSHVQAPFLIGLFSGRRAMFNAYPTCKTICEALNNVRLSVLETYPVDIFMCGGHTSLEQVTPSVERFDTFVGMWESLPNAPPIRPRGSAVACGSMLYVCGGCSNYGHATNIVDVFDSGAGAWGNTTPLLTARFGAVACVVQQDLFICGGFDQAGKPIANVECLNVASPQHLAHWKAQPPMLSARGDAAVGVVGDEFYVCGGWVGVVQPLQSVECFDLVAGEWCFAPAMSQRRRAPAGAAAARVLYVCGGWNGWEALASSESFDPERNSWETLMPMSVARYGAAGVAASGRIYVLGGSDGKLCMNVVEVFNGETAKWETLQGMLLPRYSAAGAALWG